LATPTASPRRSALDATLALATAALLAACSSSTNTLTVAGTVEIREVRLSPLASGRLERLLKDEGDSVSAGDTVAVLDQPGLEAMIRQRRALAEAAAARTAEIRVAIADSERAANDLARARCCGARASLPRSWTDCSAAVAATARLQSVRPPCANRRRAGGRRGDGSDPR
jgi:multidrug efflux pump subunit AcrA (membrane-fusion protein)